MQTIAVIPARYASSRFPGKPLLSIAGRTMIQRVYEIAKNLSMLNDVIVATDDDRIFNHVESFGGKAMMTSSLHRSGTERCAEVISMLDKPPDVVLNIQGDEPFIDPSHLRKVMDCFLDDHTQIATLVKRIKEYKTLRNPNIPKVIFNTHYQAIYFSRTPLPYLRDVEMKVWHEKFNYYKHIGIYGYRTAVLQEIVKLPAGQLELAEKLEQLRWLESGYPIRVVETNTESIAIDTPEDLSRLLAKMEGDQYLG